MVEAGPSPSLRRPGFSGRWAWVAVPMVAILAIEALQDTVPGGILLPTPVHIGALAILLLVGAGLVAGALFRRVDRPARAGCPGGAVPPGPRPLPPSGGGGGSLPPALADARGSSR